MYKKMGKGACHGVKFIWTLLLLVLSLSPAYADVIDDIAAKTDANGEVEATIHFTVPIQHLRYAQQTKSSKFLVVYFNVLDNVAKDQWQDFESHRSPPLENAPEFSVTLRDLNMSPKLEIQFVRAAEYSLKAGNDGRSLVLHIKPELVSEPPQSNALPPPPSVVAGASASVTAALPTVAKPSAAPATDTPGMADILDDIALRAGSNGETEAVLNFNTAIQRLRVVKQKQPSASLLVYFDLTDSASSNRWRAQSARHSPSSELIPAFTATVKDLNLNPKIEIEFEHATEYALIAGKDGHSLILHFKGGAVRQEKDSKSSTSLAAAIPPLVPAITAAAIAPSVVPTPSVPTPSVVTPKVGTDTAAAMQVSPPVAAASTVVQPPVLPSLVVSQPTVKKTNGARVQLGGKDGLPIFPEVDEAAVVVSSPPAAGLTLAEQIKLADSQAGLLMVKGRDAVLSGDMFAAVDAFNNVLKLPANKYTQDAQVWVGIAREKSGQPYKAQSEYETYLKLYPNGTAAMWVKDRHAKLSAVLPALPTQETVAVKTQRTDFKNMEYGSVSTYYYRGRSTIDTVTTVGATQIPTKLTRTDQSTMLSNVMMTDRFYNNEFDNRLVFQGFKATNFLPQQPSQKQLNAFYLDVRNRIDDYSLRVGRQSPYGGGVMGRFDGASAGYGVTPDYRVNVVAGRLSDSILGPKPLFYGAGVDIGVKDALGGSVYVIKQTVSGLTSRQAVGGNMRYFEHGSTAMAMLDYDTQFRAVNWATFQGTLHDDGDQIDYNFLLDHRRTPPLDIRNSVMGTANSVDVLLQNGFTQSDLIALAKQRTATSNLAMLGVNKRITENWQAGGDLSISSISGLPQSGTLINGVQVGSTLVGGTPGLEGFIPATPSTGAAWTVSGRLIGNNFITDHDISIGSLSYTKSQQMTGQMVLLTNHSSLQEQLTLDSTLRLYWQKDSFGGKQNVIAPVLKLGYRLRSSITLETEGGIEWTKSTPSVLQSSRTNRQYFSVGFRWDF